MKQFSWGVIFRGAIFMGVLFPGGFFPRTFFRTPFKWYYNPYQKQPPELFYKKAVLKFCNILRKTPVLESLFNKNAWVQACIFRPPTLLKRGSNTGVFVWILQHLYRRKAERCSVIKRNRWNVSLSIFMFSCANLYYKHAQSDSYRVGQNNRYEIYPDMNFISFLNM